MLSFLQVDLNVGDLLIFYIIEICSTNCASCNKIATCDTCSSGYGVENSACVVCALGKYSSGSGPCTSN